jgi:UDP:flavonoid glycosyltransferase YjiC (YdhE family)
MGSSGESPLLPVVLEALADLPVYVMAATAGRISANQVPSNAYVSAYLPGEAAAARASLVICNGGSPTTQQALAAGKPVLGIASNMDQYLNMEAVQRVEAGEFIRAGLAQPKSVGTVVTNLLSRPTYVEASRRMRDALNRYSASQRLQEVLAHALQRTSPRQHETLSPPP